MYCPPESTYCLRELRGVANLPAMTSGSMTQDNLGKVQGRQANVTVRPRSFARCFLFLSQTLLWVKSLFHLFLVLASCSLPVCRSCPVRCAPD